MKNLLKYIAFLCVILFLIAYIQYVNGQTELKLSSLVSHVDYLDLKIKMDDNRNMYTDMRLKNLEHMVPSTSRPVEDKPVEHKQPAIVKPTGDFATFVIGSFISAMVFCKDLVKYRLALN